MAISRIYQNVALQTGVQIELDASASHHLARVLRAKIADQVTVFNGHGGEFNCVIDNITKKFVSVSVGEFNPREAESSLNLILAQGIARGEKMDYIIQKAVELGVKKIIPLMTERCSVKLNEERREKRAQHWQSIVISACEQSGRNRIPALLPAQTLAEWLPTVNTPHCFVLAPLSSNKLHEFKVSVDSDVVLLVGPEGGLSAREIELAQQLKFSALNLGPRILRTETAAVAALTALQCKFGDMS